VKILFASWELDPFFKMGGLGDVARSLPAALFRKGVDIRNVLPFYKALNFGRIRRKKMDSFYMQYAGKREKVEIFQVLHPLAEVPVYLFANKRYLEIAKKQDTFAFFNKAICESIKMGKLDFNPDIIHCNDHHTGLIPLLVHQMKLPIKTMYTIHNLFYQGSASCDVLDKLGIDKSTHKFIQWEIKSKQINFMMEGIVHADIVTTVSPTYAREIMTEENGMGLDEILQGKEGRVFGILNGIDLDYHHAMHVIHTRYPYLHKDNAESHWESEKKLNKIFLQKKLKLKVNVNIPVLSFIGRFVPSQKGIDIMHRMLTRIDIEHYEIIILGSGNHDWEERFLWLSKFFPKNVSCNFLFDEKLARQIYAASDFILVPSKFEPCGLIQMIAMRSGTLPIAHKTGGLADSVEDGKNGFLFNNYTSYALESAVKRAIGIWHNDRSKYKEMVNNAIHTDFSWDKSAVKYLELYNKLTNGEL
jgi:starch synthase